MNTSRLDRYAEELRRMPPSGGGGCHAALLRIANFGRLAGADRDQIVQDLAASVHGTRRVTRSEIVAAVNKAFDSSPTNTPYLSMRTATPRPVINGEKLLNKIVNRAAGFTEVDLWEASPVRINWPPNNDATEVLRQLYPPHEQLFIGARHDAGLGHVLPVAEWIARFERGVAVPELIIPNPLTGQAGLTKDGKLSFRADSCVQQFRFAVGEFDGMPRESQIQFWAGVKLPIVVLLDSGGKSIHGWIRIDAANAGEWTRRVEDNLFSLLSAVGADGTCKNESRLSRMPGHLRAKKKRWQRVLYFNPNGGPILP